MTPAEFRHAALIVVDRVPANAQIVRNQVGNLSIVIDDEYAGWIDVVTGQVTLFDADELGRTTTFNRIAP